jgi:succinate dehydrogenase/fumarate reductase-like Fe-S protein
MAKRLRVKYALPSVDAAAGIKYRDFEVEVEGEVTVLDVLKMLYRQDDTISFYSYCRQGLCGGCVVELNGRRVLSCATPAQDVMEIRPIVEE